jgi:putative NIF3 family GTP cyclohydrolase 1 type 2
MAIMKLKSLYQEVVKRGIEADIRSKAQIETILKERSRHYEKLDRQEKEFFDKESLSHPFADTRLLFGSPESNVKSLIVGIDVDGAELLLADKLKTQGKHIDLVVSHHPAGRAYAQFYEVMDLQVDAFVSEGLSLSFSQDLVSIRKAEVERRVSSANHQRAVDIARLLDLNFFCMHTPCDNLAHAYVRALFKKEKPSTLGKIIELLYGIPEYRDAALNNNPPKIVVGNNAARCRKIHVEFTGGTEGPKEVYQRLSSCGVDTVVAMHQSEEHFKQCKETHMNVIFASHIASDALGVNLMLDHLEKKEKLTVYEFSGFRRFRHRGSKQ